MSRLRQIHLVPARPARRDEVTYPSEGNETEWFPQEDTHETTTRDRAAFHHPDDRCPTSMGSSLPVIGPMERALTRRKISKSCSTAERQPGKSLCMRGSPPTVKHSRKRSSSRSSSCPNIARRTAGPGARTTSFAMMATAGPVYGDPDWIGGRDCIRESFLGVNCATCVRCDSSRTRH
jgi:hypothetical protein